MTLRKLASDIAKKEGKKSQARIGDIREILRILCEFEAEFLNGETNVLGPLECLATQATRISLKKRK